MKVPPLLLLISCTLKSCFAADLRPRNLLISPSAQPSLPSMGGATEASRDQGLNLTNIQGDILIGMKKKKQLFYFFQINDSNEFKNKLPSVANKFITSTTQLLSAETQPITAVNLAFSNVGLQMLKISSSSDLGDSLYKGGQFKDATNLGDPGTSQWVSAFRNGNIHGVFTLNSDESSNVNATLSEITDILRDTITEVYRLNGQARPGDQEGHEHFGFMDGISQPAVKGFTTQPLPGQFLVSPGKILLGESGDSQKRPAWAKGGSFLVFRQLQERVPEFNKFLADNAPNVAGLSRQENIDLLGARFFGRWKSGAPVDLAPLRDDPELARDKMRNNNFTFDHPEIPGFNKKIDQTFCPFSAHIRKTRPRSDLGAENDNTPGIMIRSGIPYGPEVTQSEADSHSSDPNLERGLAFVAYQSNIANGFQFAQKIWANNVNFVHSETGVDPIIGRDSNSATVKPVDTPRPVFGANKADPKMRMELNVDFVVSHGGEYFFSPPISAFTSALVS